MSVTLGEYKAVVPISLITSKRASIGGTSSEIAQLVGIRYAVMQEPSKGMRLEEGPMKEITGGDPIQGRALFKDSVTFIPQFKLVVCTNVLFDINTNDDGPWRRIRICDFMSKFNEAPYENEDKFQKLIKFLNLELSNEQMNSARNYFNYGFDNSEQINKIRNKQLSLEFENDPE
jgi:putative DNA primase/helicase